jgi:hypothetical protein
VVELPRRVQRDHVIAHIGGLPGRGVDPDGRRRRLYILSLTRHGTGHSSVDFTPARYWHLYEDAEGRDQSR